MDKLNTFSISKYLITIQYSSKSRNIIDKPVNINTLNNLRFRRPNKQLAMNTDMGLHRKTLPAVIEDTITFWYKNGKHHNLCGPAVISNISGISYYYLDNIKYTKEDYLREVQRRKNE